MPTKRDPESEDDSDIESSGDELGSDESENESEDIIAGSEDESNDESEDESDDIIAGSDDESGDESEDESEDIISESEEESEDESGDESDDDDIISESEDESDDESESEPKKKPAKTPTKSPIPRSKPERKNVEEVKSKIPPIKEVSKVSVREERIKKSLSNKGLSSTDNLSTLLSDVQSSYPKTDFDKIKDYVNRLQKRKNLEPNQMVTGALLILNTEKGVEYDRETMEVVKEIKRDIKLA